MPLMKMLVFVVAEVRTGNGAPVVLGRWVQPAGPVSGALIWLDRDARPPETGSILGVSGRTEIAQDRRTNEPEPGRRVIRRAGSSDRPGEVISIFRPVVGATGREPGQDDDYPEDEF